MESTVQTFKGDLIKAIWDHGLRMIKPTLVLSIILFVASAALMFFTFSSMFGWDLAFLSELSSNPLENQRLLEERMGNYVNDPFAFFRSFALIFIVIMVLQALIYSLYLKMSGNVAYGESDSISAAWNKLKAKHVGNILLYIVVMLVIYLVLAMIMGLILAATHPALAFILIPLLLLVMVRFVNVVPALVLGDKTIGQAFSFSWETITFKRALLIVVGIIVSYILLIILFLVLGFLAGLLGTVGAILSVILYLALNVFLVALGISFLTAIYYRYAIIESDDTMIDAIGTE